jgi:hypothetical protein
MATTTTRDEKDDLPIPSKRKESAASAAAARRRRPLPTEDNQQDAALHSQHTLLSQGNLGYYNINFTAASPSSTKHKHDNHAPQSPKPKQTIHPDSPMPLAQMHISNRTDTFGNEATTTTNNYT